MRRIGRRVLTGGVLAFILVTLVPLAKASAPPGRYTVDTGTIVDNILGLVWQRAAASGTYTWYAAQYYCTNLNAAGSGAPGWRLPRKLELESLLDDSRTNPAIDTNAFPGTPSTCFWSSTPFSHNNAIAYCVDFGNGGTIFDADRSHSVRCVH